MAPLSVCFITGIGIMWLDLDRIAKRFLSKIIFHKVPQTPEKTSTKMYLAEWLAEWIFNSRVSSGGYKIVSVCLLVSDLLAEPFDLPNQYIVEKVIGQRSRSLGWKKWFSNFQMGWPVHVHFVMSYEVNWRHLASLGKNTDTRARCGMAVNAQAFL